MEQKDLKFKKSLLAFIDILGFSNFVKKAAADDEIRTRLISSLKRLKHLKDSSSNTGVITSDFDISVFSDSIVLTCDARKAHSLFWVCGYLQADLLLLGLPSRGGIVLGDIYHKEGVLVGPAMLEAYAIENSAAVYPRVVVSPSVEKILLPAVAARWIEHDTDGLSFLNCFRFHSVVPGQDALVEDGYNPREVYLASVRSHILSNLQQAKKLDHVAKWRWLAQRYNIALKDEEDDLGGRVEAIGISL